jgi:TolB-like protein/cytochrome c-type biogenesis protein CcmH/NrfG
MGEESPKPAITPTGAVFLSYASEDVEPAKRICNALREAGIEVWFDQTELRGGDIWDRRIRQQIHDCRLFIALISAHTEARDEGYFRREWKLAIDRTHDMAEDKAFVVPVAIDGTSERSARVPDPFKHVQWTRLLDGKTTSAFVERVGRLLSPDSSPDRGAKLSSSTSVVISPTSVREPRRSNVGLRITGAVIAVALAAIAVDRFLLSRRSQPPTPPAVPPTQTSARAPATAVAFNPPPRSIAVLPFVNMSGDKEQEYFSDGLTEELIDRLTAASNLLVIARTSSFQFKGKSEDVRAIASKLGVAHLLEGSVRKSGKSLRVTAQLVRASDGTHLWSHSYDEHVADIFKVQEAIAGKVARELESTLSAGSIASSRTTSLQAYEAVQKGNYFWHRSEAGDNDRALALFDEATRLDPNYAFAWYRVGAVYQLLGYLGTLPVANARSKAMTAVQRALSIDPTLAAAHRVLADIYRDFDWNWRAAKEEFETAAHLDPNGGSEAAAGYLNWMMTGDDSEGIVALRQDLIRNPLSTGTLYGLGIAYWATQRYQEAADAYERLMELNPRYSGAPSLYAQALLFQGQYSKALATAKSDSDKLAQLGVLPCIYWKLGQKPESDAALRELEKDAAKSAYTVATMYACREDVDHALAWLDRAYRERQAGMPNMKFDPFLLHLHADPRFQALLVKMNLADVGAGH